MAVVAQREAKGHIALLTLGRPEALKAVNDNTAESSPDVAEKRPSAWTGK